MEMEMDKFLAKKSQIYNKSIFQTKFLEESGDQEEEKTSQDTSLELYIFKSIMHLLLKSIFEMTRQSRILFPKIYN